MYKRPGCLAMLVYQGERMNRLLSKIVYANPGWYVGVMLIGLFFDRTNLVLFGGFLLVALCISGRRE